MTLPEALRASFPDDDPGPALAIAGEAEAAGDLRLAATALDRAYGLATADPGIRERRQNILDRLAVTEHGLVFRYIPAGTFLMGSEDGDPDERPVRSTLVDAFWMSETTISWGVFCRLLNWTPPPARPGLTPPERFFMDLWGEHAAHDLEQAFRVRLQYCEDATAGARDWHDHDPAELARRAHGAEAVPAGAPGRFPDRAPDTPWRYEDKPMVAVSWQEAEALAATVSTAEVRYGLPTEPQWERAARAGLIGCRYAWGNEPPTAERCDFGSFAPYAIKPCRAFPPNGYGLYAMCGSVWEWTSDYYDGHNPTGAALRATERVLRGGSWTDPAEAVTVSFRMSRRGDLSGRPPANYLAPNIGFRLARFERHR